MLNQIYSILQSHAPEALLVVLLILSVFVEVSKIHLNPWQEIGKVLKKGVRGFGKVLMGELAEQVSQINDRLETMELTQKEDKKTNLKRSINRFADECINGVRHSKEMFDDVIRDCSAYEAICKDTNDPNGVIEDNILYIRELYHKCKVERLFLQGDTKHSAS